MYYHGSLDAHVPFVGYDLISSNIFRTPGTPSGKNGTPLKGMIKDKSSSISPDPLLERHRKHQVAASSLNRKAKDSYPGLKRNTE